MTQSEIVALLDRAIIDRNDDKGQGGQALVARELGYSPPYINQLRSGKMAISAAVRAKILELYGLKTIECPELGPVTHAICAEERKKPFTTSRHRLHRACKACPQNGGKP